VLQTNPSQHADHNRCILLEGGWQWTVSSAVITQRALQAKSDISPRVMQLHVLQEMADGSPRVSQLRAFHDIANSRPFAKRA
jgi:hypothetical protein